MARRSHALANAGLHRCAPRAHTSVRPHPAGAACSARLARSQAEFMKERCPSSCPKLKRKKGTPPPTPAKPKDANPSCGTWAAAGECDANPAYMLQECPVACSGDASEADAQDIHQDCAAWVSDGECYRNPAFMLQQCKASCSKFAADNDSILQDTSDTCVNFALRGGCEQDPKRASTVCRASCHIQRICSNHTETVTCSKALRCEAIGAALLMDRTDRPPMTSLH